MILDVVKYGHPVLRKNGAEVTDFGPETAELIENMLETMDDYHGIGLAAQQIAKPIRLAGVDISAVEDRPSFLEVDGKEADPNSIMPLVLINPELTPEGDPEAVSEGCLSFPEIYGEVTRPGFVHVVCKNGKGEEMKFKAGGLLARVIQHETDHLKGILFIDRMDRESKDAIKARIDAMAEETRAGLAAEG